MWGGRLLTDPLCARFTSGPSGLPQANGGWFTAAKPWFELVETAMAMHLGGEVEG